MGESQINGFEKALGTTGERAPNLFRRLVLRLSFRKMFGTINTGLE